jgi:hypothetical protein
MIEDDGDIIRGLGFVALYSGYLDEQIDDLLTMLSVTDLNNGRQRPWQISKKIKHAVKLLKRLDVSEFPELEQNLNTCLQLFEDRNELIQGRIYPNIGLPHTLRSGRALPA